MIRPFGCDSWASRASSFNTPLTKHARDWTADDEMRMRELVRHAHSGGLWIRFYTLDGATTEELSCHGWFRSYNFGTLEAAKQRWRSAMASGVDYIATDQYEQLAESLKAERAQAASQVNSNSKRGG